MTKVRNIMHAGGKAAIIIDSQNENITRVYMSDDGTGSGLAIPAVLIGKKDGQILTDYIKSASSAEKKQIKVNVHFQSPPKRERVQFQYWFTSSDERSMVFLQQLATLMGQQAFDRVDFEPKFVTWACPTCSKEFIGTNCMSGGQYCGHIQSVGSSRGQDVIMEDLRIRCLYQKLNHTYHQFKFFDYITAVHDLCPDEVVSQKCHELGVKAMDIPLELREIDECVDTSFE